MKKFCGQKGIVSLVFKMYYVLRLKRNLGITKQLECILLFVCVVLTHLFTVGYFCMYFSPCRIFLPFSSPCAILLPAANKQIAAQGWCHPTSAGKTSKNLNPSISNIVYSPSLFPNFKSTYASSLGIQGSSQGHVSVSFNRLVA